MALTDAQKNKLADIFIGYFNRAPDPAGFQFYINVFNTRLAEGVSETEILDTIASNFGNSPEAQGLYPFLVTPDVSGIDGFLAAVYQNLFNRVPDAGADFWKARILDPVNPLSPGVAIRKIIEGAQAGGTDRAILDNKEIVALDFVTKAANIPGFVFDANAKAAATAAVKDVDDTDASVTTAKAGTDAFLTGNANGGETFTLINGVDNIEGTDGNDIINGVVEDDNNFPGPNTFGPGDIINGGAGVDTLRLTQIDNTDNFGDGFGAGATVSNVEILKIVQAYSTSADFDLGGFTGLQQIVADMTYDTTYYFYNLQEELVSVTMDGSRADENDRDMEIQLDDMSNSIYMGDDDTLTINVINAGNEESTSSAEFSADNLAGDEVLENYNVMVGGDNNYLYINNNTDAAGDDIAKTVTVSNMAGNSGSLWLELDEEEALETVDASAMTGNFRYEFSDTNVGQEVSVTTGSGDDNIEIDEGKFTVDLGAGDDRVELDTFGGDADDTNDVLDGGDGRDTISMDPDAVATLLSLNPVNFEVLALNSGAGAAVIVDADDYGFEEVTLEANINQTLTLEDFNGGTLTIENTQSAAIIVESNTLADTLDIVIDNNGNVNLNGGLDLSNVEMVSFSSTEADADLQINTAALNVTGVDMLSFSGAGDVDINFATVGADDVANIDMSGLTGKFDNDGFAFFGATTDVKLGNIGGSSILELSAAVGRNVLEFGAELDNDIRIDLFQTGAGITADALDFSALGVTGLSDLTFVDTGADVTIDSALFDGTITLAGVANINDLAAGNFVFA